MEHPSFLLHHSLKNRPLVCHHGPFHPQPHHQLHSELGTYPAANLKKCSSQTIYFSFQFLSLSAPPSPRFRKCIFPTQQLLLAVVVLNLNTPHVVAAALVFSLCIFGSVFPLADLCLGAAKIKRAFWCRPGCLCKCRNAAQSSAP